LLFRPDVPHEMVKKMVQVPFLAKSIANPDEQKILKIIY
jgi:hypothetical protein